MELNVIESFKLILSCFKENQLPDFIEQIESILTSIETFDEKAQKLLFSYIKNRCVGQTREFIHRSATVTNWKDLKEILLKNVGEKQNSVESMDEMKTC